MALADIAAKIGQSLSGSLNRYALSVEGGAQGLDVESFTGDESLSHCYRYVINFTSVLGDITPQQMLLKTATFSFNAPGMQLAGISLPAAEPRAVHGVITQFRRLSSSVDETRYQATLEPRLALLGNTSRPAIFQNQSVPEIVEQILRDNHEFEGWQFDFRLRNSYPRREQVMQWQETDLAFVERLLSEVGIWYRFEADSRLKQEIVVFADDQQYYEFGVSLPLRALSGMNDSATESVWKLTSVHQVVSQSVQVKDYNYRDAHNGLLTDADVTRGDDTTYGEVYRYGDNYLTQGESQEPAAEAGSFYARLRHERLLNAQHQLNGESNAASLQPGQMLDIVGDVPELFRQGVVITAISTRGGRDSSFTLAWQGMPYSETVGFRPALLPRPTIAGTLQARVTSVTENDTYSHLDESGRYRVKFDFDLTNWKAGYESLWVRLAKPYSGDTYGLHMPLIAGAEVAIAFEEGNPDRPYIAYALHDSRHGDHVTADNHKRNVIRTPANNKLRMEDERGKEHIKVSTEYGGKSQLNLGHLVDSQRAQRGEGFELRSDNWGAIRAGKGLFLSADAQPLGKGQALDMQAAIAQLNNALALAQALSQSVSTSGAYAADLAAQEQLQSALTQLNGAGLLASAPAGVAVTTPENMQMTAGKNLTTTAGASADFSIMKRFTVAAGDAISFFAQKLGIKMYAARGPVAIQAQTGTMQLQSDQALSVNSVNGEITLNAAQGITLVSNGGAYIKIKDGSIELGAPGAVSIKNDNISWGGSASLDKALEPMTIADPEFKNPMSERFQVVDKTTKQPKSHVPYRIEAEDGSVVRGVTDQNGYTQQHSGLEQQKIQLFFE